MSVTSLGDVLARPQSAAGLSPAERQRLLEQAAAVLVVLTTIPTLERAENVNGDRMLTPAEAAAIANVEVPWIWRRARRADWRPFTTKLSRKSMRISERGFRRWLAGQGPERGRA